MSISKRGNVYWYEFVRDGVRHRGTTKTTNKRAAELIEGQIKLDIATDKFGIVGKKQAPTFKVAMQDFLQWSEATNKASTHRRYRISSIPLFRWFQQSRLDKISSDDVEKFKVARSKEHKTARSGHGRKATSHIVRPATVNRELACLKAMFNFVIKADSLSKNPVSKVKFLNEDNLQDRVLDFDEQHRYLAKATPLLRDIATLIVNTGMRPEEVYRLRAEDVDLIRRTIRILWGKTPAARRILPMTDAAAAVLRMRKRTTASGYLFPCETDSSRPVPKVNNAHDRTVKASGVAPFRLYDLRHTWATRAAESEMHPSTLASLLGHSRIQMMMRYVHHTQIHQREAMEKFEQFSAARHIAEYETKLRQKTEDEAEAGQAMPPHNPPHRQKSEPGKRSLSD